jgi:O-antigen/teichoic acid export membrane protein
VDTIVLWITVRWRPKLEFSLERFRGLFSYGWKLLASSLIDTTYNNLRQLIIGKLYTADSLAFYNRGYMIPNVFVGNVNTAIDSVIFPVLSGEQSSRETVRNMTRRSIRISSYVMWPIMFGIAACARPLVLVLLTDKWEPAVPFVMMFCC